MISEINNNNNNIISKIWKDSAVRYSSRLVVADRYSAYTYQEAETVISRLRAYLKAQGATVGSVIALDTFHRAEFWLAVMAIVTSGCAYLPIPPQYPAVRRQYMIRNSNAVLHLTEAEIFRICTDPGAPVCGTVSDTPESPCYVIYTSGTTGQPKGVLIRQNWLLNLCRWNLDVTELHAGDCVLSLNSLCFDASVKNIFSPMMTGASLLMNIENPADIRALYAYLAEKQPTHINATPSMLDVLLEEAGEHEYAGMQSVQCIMSGGEVFQKKQLCAFRQAKQGALRVINVYGPTECTSVTAYHVLTEQDFAEPERPVPVGKPIPGKEILLVREDGGLCRPGEKGELYITGLGIAEGYLGDPIRTAEKFVSYQGQSCYRSGDICYTDPADPEGLLYYSGRTDTQIKLNGYRIETEEIASRACALPEIRSAAVLFTDGKLVLCYTASARLPEETLRTALADILPAYMLPASYYYLPEMPMTERGKIDFAGLQTWYTGQSSQKSQTDTGIQPESIIAKVLAVWENLLGTTGIQPTDNFFDAGGNSLKLYKMGKMLEKAFSVRIDPMDLMELSSAKKIAQYI